MVAVVVGPERVQVRAALHLEVLRDEEMVEPPWLAALHMSLFHRALTGALPEGVMQSAAFLVEEPPDCVVPPLAAALHAVKRPLFPQRPALVVPIPPQVTT